MVLQMVRMMGSVCHLSTAQQKQRFMALQTVMTGLMGNLQVAVSITMDMRQCMNKADLPTDHSSSRSHVIVRHHLSKLGLPLHTSMMWQRLTRQTLVMVRLQRQPCLQVQSLHRQSHCQALPRPL